MKKQESRSRNEEARIKKQESRIKKQEGRRKKQEGSDLDADVRMGAAVRVSSLLDS
jgi:hypothetical protein